MTNKQDLITSLLSSMVMAAMMSGVLSAYRQGFTADWPVIWLHSFLIAWPCAFVLNIMVLPQLRKLSAWLAKRL